MTVPALPRAPLIAPSAGAAVRATQRRSAHPVAAPPVASARPARQPRARSKAAIAACRSSLVCAADIWVRMRALPRGTTGNENART